MQYAMNFSQAPCPCSESFEYLSRPCHLSQGIFTFISSNDNNSKDNAFILFALGGKKQRTWELQLLEHRIQTQPGSSKEKEAFNIFKAPLQQASATFSVAGIKYNDQGNF